jgi:hypothetical protein
LSSEEGGIPLPLESWELPTTIFVYILNEWLGFQSHFAYITFKKTLMPARQPGLQRLARSQPPQPDIHAASLRINLIPSAPALTLTPE